MIKTLRSPPTSAHTSKAWSIVSMNFTENCHTPQGHPIIPVVTDLLTRIELFIPFYTVPTAWEMSWLFMENIFCNHWSPMGIISDQSPQFRS